MNPELDKIKSMLTETKLSEDTLSPIADLPNEILLTIFESLHPNELERICPVSRRWFVGASHGDLWRKFLKVVPPHISDKYPKDINDTKFRAIFWDYPEYRKLSYLAADKGGQDNLLNEFLIQYGKDHPGALVTWLRNNFKAVMPLLENGKLTPQELLNYAKKYPGFATQILCALLKDVMPLVNADKLTPQNLIRYAYEHPGFDIQNLGYALKIAMPRIQALQNKLPLDIKLGDVIIEYASENGLNATEEMLKSDAEGLKEILKVMKGGKWEAMLQEQVAEEPETEDAATPPSSGPKR